MRPTKIPPFDELCKLFNYTPKGKPLTTEECAEILRMKPGALVQLRFKGGGPDYSKKKGQRRVLYFEPIVLEYLYKGMRSNTSDNVAA
jgi:hypothetical protein